MREGKGGREINLARLTFTGAEFLFTCTCSNNFLKIAIKKLQ